MGNYFDWNNFNAEEIEPDNFDAIPAGEYPCIITDSEWKETKSGEGQYLQLSLQVADGDYAGRLLWDRLNLVNPNDKAVEIAQKTMSAICRATGVMHPQDSSDLHNIPLLVRVKQGSYDGNPTNEVKGYKALEGGKGKVQEPAGASRAAPGKSGTKTPPWKK